MKNNASVRKSKVDLDPPDALLKTKEIELDAKRASSSSSSSSEDEQQACADPDVISKNFDRLFSTLTDL